MPNQVRRRSHREGSDVSSVTGLDLRVDSEMNSFLDEPSSTPKLVLSVERNIRQSTLGTVERPTTKRMVHLEKYTVEQSDVGRTLSVMSQTTILISLLEGITLVPLS